METMSHYTHYTALTTTHDRHEKKNIRECAREANAKKKTHIQSTNCANPNCYVRRHNIIVCIYMHELVVNVYGFKRELDERA